VTPPLLRVLSETTRHLSLVDPVVGESAVTGNLIHDAHLVALQSSTACTRSSPLDGDFARFPRIASRNPFSH